MKNGFTLIELMIVLAIIGIIMSVAVSILKEVGVIRSSNVSVTGAPYPAYPQSDTSTKCISGYLFVTGGSSPVQVMDNGSAVKCN